MNPTDAEKQAAREDAERKYRETHDRWGHALGTPELPNNREGRRRMARSWRGVR